MKMLELIQMGTWCPLCSERVSFTFEKWHQQGAWNYTPWTWGGRIWTPRDAHNVPRAEAQLMSCPGKGSGHGGGWGPQKRPEGEASPGHVADIRAREELGILRGVAGWHIPERAKCSLESHGPGSWRPALWGALGVQVAGGSSAPGAAADRTALQGDSKRDIWRASLASAQPLRIFLLQAPSKNKLLHGQRNRNAQTGITKYSDDNLRRRLLNSHQRPGLTIPLRCKKSGRSRLKTQEQNRKSS